MIEILGFQFHIIELPLVIYLLLDFVYHFFVQQDRQILSDKTDQKIVGAFLVAAGFFFVAKMISFFPALDRQAVVIDGIKWAEIFLIA